MTFELPYLPFDEGALEPFLSRETIRTHFLGHHKAYIDNLNKLLLRENKQYGSIERIIQNCDGPLYNNAAQVWNHTFYWHGLTSASKSRPPTDSGDFDDAVEASFGGWPQMREKFEECANGLFGSGWTWLTVDGQNYMEFSSTQNAANPLRFERLRPLWTCDLWEHAYYLDYKNKKAKYIEGIWNYVNWDFVETNFQMEGMPFMTKFMIAGSANAPMKEL